MTNLGIGHLGLGRPMMRLDFAFDGSSKREIHDFMSSYDLAIKEPGLEAAVEHCLGLAAPSHLDQRRCL